VSDTRNYAAVTAAYWAFTLTDGALRMLVLLHFHGLGFTPVDIELYPGKPYPAAGAWSEIRYWAYCYVMPKFKP